MKTIFILLFLSNAVFASDYSNLENHLKENNKPTANKSIEELDKNTYLYTHEGVAISSGLYYVNLKNNIHLKISGGFPAIITKAIKNNNTFLLVYSQGFWKGLMSDEYITISIKPNGKYVRNRILSYSQSGESGFCTSVENRLEIAGEVKSHKVIEIKEGYEISFKVKEQNCKTGIFTEKTITKKIKV